MEVCELFQYGRSRGRRWWRGLQVVVVRVKRLVVGLEGLVDTSHDVWVPTRIHWAVVQSLVA